jgi:pimeloyl-ACP methyl ester carboxylesterase
MLLKALYSSLKGLPLAADCYPKHPTRTPIIVIPGLFGSKQNWATIAKALSTTLNTTVYSIDLRNHGASPHSNHHSYESMKADVHLFITKNNIEKADVIGHRF